jgi:two-component system, sensor histidine kinase and response regulator
MSTQATILVVDDMPENLRLLLAILNQQGYTVRLASSGPMALQSVDVAIPDLILLDIKMPDMSGYEVCERLQAAARTRDIPVIFISALSDLQDKVQGFAVGGVDYLTKPLQAQEVLARIQTHLKLRSLQQALLQEIHRRTEAEDELRVLNQQLQEANQDLHSLNEQLQQANASKDTFFSILAHDLRSPFTGLLTLTEVLAHDIQHFTKDQIQQKLRTLHTASENVYELLTDLLTWSRLQRGVLEYQPTALPLFELVEHTLHILAAEAERKSIRLRSAIPRDVEVYGDYNMVNTIIRNLLSNALKFTPTDGTITVVSRYAGGNVEIAVRDTGIGMPADLLEKIFRIDQKTSRKGTAGEPGTGLGLILCKELAERNHGGIRVESQVGQGATFTFTLPLVSSSAGNMQEGR